MRVILQEACIDHDCRQFKEPVCIKSGSNNILKAVHLNLTANFIAFNEAVIVVRFDQTCHEVPQLSQCIFVIFFGRYKLLLLRYVSSVTPIFLRTFPVVVQ